MAELFRFYCWLMFAFMCMMIKDTASSSDLGSFISAIFLAINLFYCVKPFEVGTHLTKLGKHFLRSILAVISILTMLILLKNLGGVFHTLTLIFAIVPIVVNYFPSIAYSFKYKRTILKG